jgi:Uma2 family endonuclease
MTDALADGKGYHYTYKEYCAIDDDSRYEVIDGDLFMMASPSPIHQIAVGEIYKQLSLQLDGKPCKPFLSPLDVRLFYREDGSDDTVVQPDVFVVCDKSKIADKYIKGAPDFVVEVLSASTSNRDLIIKAQKYAKAGVKEYWLLDIERKLLIKGTLAGDFYSFEFVNMVNSVLTSSGIHLDMNALLAALM